MDSYWFDLYGVADIDANTEILSVKATEDELCNYNLSVGARLLWQWIKFIACHKDRKSLTQSGMATAIGVSTGTIQKWIVELSNSGMLKDIPELLNRPSYVYFIQSIHGGPIKIGKAIDPEHRLEQIQTGYPERLNIIKYIPGGLMEELVLHKKFANLRLHGEWFMAAPELVAYIGSLT